MTDLGLIILLTLDEMHTILLSALNSQKAVTLSRCHICWWFHWIGSVQIQHINSLILDGSNLNAFAMGVTAGLQWAIYGI